MRRKHSKNTRQPNRKERSWQKWLKHQPCSFCNHPPPAICDHAKGQAFKHGKVLIGHAWCNSKCLTCDTMATAGFRADLFKLYKKNDSDATLEQMKQYEEETGISFSDEERAAIADVYAVSEDTTNEWLTKL